MGGETPSGAALHLRQYTKKLAIQPLFRRLFFSRAVSTLVDVTEIPEEQQAAALRVVADSGKRRTAAQTEADRILAEEVRPAVIEAARLGASRSRIRVLAGIGPNTLYTWLQEEGLEVRPKRTARADD